MYLRVGYEDNPERLHAVAYCITNADVLHLLNVICLEYVDISAVICYPLNHFFSRRCCILYEALLTWVAAPTGLRRLGSPASETLANALIEHAVSC